MDIKKCVLSSGGKVKYSKLKGENIIEFDRKYLQPINTIVEIEVAGNALDIKPMDFGPQSFSSKKQINNLNK